MRLSRRQLATLLFLTLAVWVAGHLILGADLTHRSLALMALALGSFLGMGMALEFVLWRMPFLQGWFVRRPDLRGTWRVEVHPDSESYHAAGQRLPPPSFMGVTQTLSTLNMHLMSKETESWFISDALSFSRRQGGYQLIGVYKTRPHARQPGPQIEVHVGGLIIETQGSAHHPTLMRGQYWTDLKTNGTMVLTKASKRVYHHYSEAEKGDLGLS